jgi:hypothetical protein
MMWDLVLFPSNVAEKQLHYQKKFVT